MLNLKKSPPDSENILDPWPVKQPNAEKLSSLTRNFFIGSALSLILFLATPLNLSPYSEILVSLGLIALGGKSFFKGFKRDIRAHALSFDTLLSLSAWAAFLMSSYAVFFPENLPPGMRGFYWIFIIELIACSCLGRIFEIRFQNRRRRAALGLNQKIPTSARVLRSGKESFVFLSEISGNDQVLIRKGEEIPIDGICLSKGIVDESLLNDRKAPSPKSEGSPVWGGSFVQSESLKISAGKNGSVFSRAISSIIKNADFKYETSSPVNFAAAWAATASIVTAVAVSILWALEAPNHRMAFALVSLASVLIMACPPALALARPIAWIIGSRYGSRNGASISYVDSIDRSRKIDTLLFDKTGILTSGRPLVSEMTTTSNGNKEELLNVALSALQNSPHLSAQAVARYARNMGAKPLPEPDSIESFPGKGIRLRGRGGEIRAGNLSWLKEEGCPLPPMAPLAPGETLSLIGISRDARLLGYFTLKDSLLSSVHETLTQIKNLGIDPILVSGDRNESAHRLAEEIGIRRVFAEVAPGEKEAIVQRLQSEGKCVAFVGSSFYDAAALSLSDLGIAWESGNPIAKEAADLVIKNTNLSEILFAIELNQNISRNAQRNILLSLTANALFLPIAGGFFYLKYGIVLTPLKAVMAGLLGISLVIASSTLQMNNKEKK